MDLENLSSYVINKTNHTRCSGFDFHWNIHNKFYVSCQNLFNNKQIRIIEANLFKNGMAYTKIRKEMCLILTSITLFVIAVRKRFDEIGYTHVFKFNSSK